MQSETSTWAAGDAVKSIPSVRRRMRVGEVMSTDVVIMSRSCPPAS